MARLQRKKTVVKNTNKKTVIETADVAGPAELEHQAAGNGAVAEIPRKKTVESSRKNKPENTFVQKISRIGYIEKTIRFLREVNHELKKVTWPTRKQTMASTVVVLVLVLIISAFLGVVDRILFNLIQLLLK